MLKKANVVILMTSIVLLIMQNSVQAKYVFSYENTSIQLEIDKNAPVIEGAEENGKYNHDIEINYYDKAGIKEAIYYYNSEEAKFDNTAIYFESGSKFSKEGYYKIIVTDNYDNSAKIEQFLIDKTKPEITGIEEGVVYDLPPDIQYYDKYGIEKVEIKLPEELDIIYNMRASNRRLESDRTESTITVSIHCTPQNVKEYRWYIKSETEKEYKLIESNLKEEYTFENLESDMTYNIYCIAITDEEKAYMSNSITATTLKVEKIEITEITNTGYTIKVTGIPEKYSSMYFPSWTAEGYQDDIIWYEEKIENNECTFNLDYNKHSKQTGTYQTHIYANENGSRIFLQSAKVWIQENEPEPEKINPAGKTEVIVTDIAGNVSKEEYYTDKVVSISYSTTNGIYNYLKVKELLEGKILEFNDDKCELKIKQSELDKITKLEITNYIDPNGEIFMGLKYFRNLEYLDLQGSTAFNTNELETLGELKYLDISNCATKDKVYDMNCLSETKQLEYLNTQGTIIENEEIIQNLPNLKEWKN